jgi:hypothetical protein
MVLPVKLLVVGPVPTRNCCFTVPNSTSRGLSATTLMIIIINVLEYLYGLMVPLSGNHEYEYP